MSSATATPANASEQTAVSAVTVEALRACFLNVNTGLFRLSTQASPH